MFEINIRTHFSAAHHLAGYQGSCAAMHGHNWGVEVFVRGRELDEMGMLIDFRVLKTSVRELLKEIDHTDLNQSAEFALANPTSENISRFLFQRLAAALDCPRYWISKVTVCETPDSTSSYCREGEPGSGKEEGHR